MCLASTSFPKFCIEGRYFSAYLKKGKAVYLAYFRPVFWGAFSFFPLLLKHCIRAKIFVLDAREISLRSYAVYMSVSTKNSPRPLEMT